jgi:hypothetical protein
MTNNQESTYTLLVRSEEKSRGALETVAYGSVFLGVIFAVWQFAAHPIKIPASGIESCVTCQTETVQTNSAS